MRCLCHKTDIREHRRKTQYEMRLPKGASPPLPKTCTLCSAAALKDIFDPKRALSALLGYVFYHRSWKIPRDDASSALDLSAPGLYFAVEDLESSKLAIVTSRGSLRATFNIHTGLPLPRPNPPGAGAVAVAFHNAPFWLLSSRTLGACSCDPSGEMPRTIALLSVRPLSDVPLASSGKYTILPPVR